MKKINIFPELPGMQKEDVSVGQVTSCGPNTYQVILDGASEQDYRAYLEDLEKAGYAKFADNGAGLGNSVYTTTYTKDNFVLTVTYMKKQSRMYLIVGIGQALSEHLQKKQVAERRICEQTKLHMIELWWYGNSFIIQLKNGHFVISDGGLSSDTRYLLDYLEELAPEGEKPVIEAWTITHAHADHCEVLVSFARDREKEFTSRIYVEGIYFSEPNEEVKMRLVSGLDDIGIIKKAAKRLCTTQGERPQIYRPQTGQRYYFDDVTMDIVHCQEQLPCRQYECQDYNADYNDSSTWYLFTIEGQKVLMPGDGDVGSMKVVMNTYEREFLKVDMMTLSHHGHNTWNPFTDYCQVQTLLVTAKDNALPVKRKEENQYLYSKVEEWISGWGDGTKIFTFPYQIGTYKTLPCREWIYHEGVERKEAPGNREMLNIKR